MNCVDCGDVITNPICPNCMGLAFLSLIRDNNLFSTKKLISNNYFPKFDFDSQTCVICGKEMSVCSFCSLKEYSLWLSEKGVENSTIKSAFYTLSGVKLEKDLIG